MPATIHNEDGPARAKGEAVSNHQRIRKVYDNGKIHADPPSVK